MEFYLLRRPKPTPAGLCRHCGTSIASGFNVCANCGRAQVPWYDQHKYALAVLIVAALVIVGVAITNHTQAQSHKIVNKELCATFPDAAAQQGIDCSAITP